MIEHSSCCAVHNEPATPNGPCACLAGLPDFRTFYVERSGFRVFPCPVGTPLDQMHRALAETLADYADEIRKRA